LTPFGPFCLISSMKIKSSNNAFLSSKIDKPPRKHGKSLRLCEKRYKTDHLCRERI
jgi:hypothetical protein